MIEIDYQESEPGDLSEYVSEYLLADIAISTRKAERMAQNYGTVTEWFNYYFNGEVDCDYENIPIPNDKENTEVCISPLITLPEPELREWSDEELMYYEPRLEEDTDWEREMSYRDWLSDDLINETRRDDQIGQRVKLINFESGSKGRRKDGSQRRRPYKVEVEMLVIDSNYALPVIRNEIRSNKKWSWASKPDSLAEELMGDGATSSDLLEEVRRRTR